MQAIALRLKTEAMDVVGLKISTKYPTTNRAKRDEIVE